MRDAHRQAEEALEELRSTIRGIHPRELVDHGLEAAVHELADRSAVPVSVDIRLAERLPRVGRAGGVLRGQRGAHQRGPALGGPARRVHGWRARDTSCSPWRTTEGRSRDRRRGSGLAGLGLRLEALGGELCVTSPPGGPTEVRMECPCAA